MRLAIFCIYNTHICSVTRENKANASNVQGIDFNDAHLKKVTIMIMAVKKFNATFF